VKKEYPLVKRRDIRICRQCHGLVNKVFSVKEQADLFMMGVAIETPEFKTLLFGRIAEGEIKKRLKKIEKARAK